MNMNYQGMLKPEEIPFKDPNADMAVSHERKPEADKKVYLVGTVILFSLMCLYFIVFVFNDFFIISDGLSKFCSFTSFAIDLVFVAIMIITAKHGVKRYWALYLLSPIISLFGVYILFAMFGRAGAIIANILPYVLLIWAIIMLFSRDERTRKLPFIATYVTTLILNFATSTIGKDSVVIFFVVSIFTVCAVNIFMLITMAFPNESMSLKSQGRFLALIILLAIIPSATIYGGAFSDVHKIRNTKNLLSSSQNYELQADSSDEYQYVRLWASQNPYYIYDPAKQIQAEGYVKSGAFLRRQQLGASRDGDYLIISSSSPYWRLKGSTIYKISPTPDTDLYPKTILTADTAEIFNVTQYHQFSSEVEGYYTVTSDQNFNITTISPEKNVGSFSSNASHKIYMSPHYTYIFQPEFDGLMSLNVAFYSTADGLSAQSALQFDEYRQSSINISLAPNTPTYIRYICKSRSDYIAQFAKGLEGISIEMDTKYRVIGDSVNFSPQKDQYGTYGCTFILTAKTQTSFIINISPNNNNYFSAKSAVAALSSPQNLIFEKRKEQSFPLYYMEIKWDGVANSNGYIVKKYRGNEMLETITTKSTSAKFSEMTNVKGDYYFSVMAIGDDVNFLDSATARSDVYTVALQKLETPQNVRITQRTLTWDATANATGYSIRRGQFHSATISDKYDCTYEIPDHINGEVWYEVVAMGDGFDYSDSDGGISNTVTFEKIKVATPYNLEISGNQISWECDDSKANNYTYSIIDKTTDRVLKSGSTTQKFVNFSLGYGEFYFTVKASSRDGNSYADSEVATSGVYSKPRPTITGSITLSGEARYGCSLLAVYKGNLGGIKYTWYVNGELSENSQSGYYFDADDIGKEIYVTATHGNYDGALKSETLTVLKATIANNAFSPSVKALGINFITFNAEQTTSNYAGVTFIVTDGENTFEQDSLTFENLKPNTEYTVHYKFDNPFFEYYESPKIKVTTNPARLNFGKIDIVRDDALKENSKISLPKDLTSDIRQVIWLRNNSAIEGQSLPEYTITNADSGCAISAMIILNNGDIITTETTIVNDFLGKSPSVLPFILKTIFAFVGIAGITALYMVFRKLIKQSRDNKSK